MYAIHATAGAWQVMWHGNAFVQYLDETGQRGSQQAGSINWIMGMARRSVGAGRLGLRGMVSLEPLTIRGCGYPDSARFRRDVRRRADSRPAAPA